MFWSGAGGELQTYQIRTASASSSLPQTVVMASSMGLTPGKTDDPTMKREIRLAKNRSGSFSSAAGSVHHGNQRHSSTFQTVSVLLSLIIIISYQLESHLFPHVPMSHPNLPHDIHQDGFLFCWPGGCKHSEEARVTSKCQVHEKLAREFRIFWRNLVLLYLTRSSREKLSGLCCNLFYFYLLGIRAATND